MKMIRTFKIIVALGFLATAYAYISDSKILRVFTEVFLFLFSFLGFIVIFLDYRNKQRKKKRG